MTTDTLTIDISVQPIELCKLLKIANMVGGGGEAKIVISEGYVLVNGEVEYQKRKKIYHNDIIEFNGECIRANVVEELEQPVAINYNKPPTDTNDKIKKTSKAKAKTKSKTASKQKNDIAVQIEPAKTKRRPISF